MSMVCRACRYRRRRGANAADRLPPPKTESRLRRAAPSPYADVPSAGLTWNTKPGCREPVACDSVFYCRRANPYLARCKARFRRCSSRKPGWPAPHRSPVPAARHRSNKPELVVVVESPVSEARMRDMFKAIDTVLRRHKEVGEYNQTI
jgi:hypothetical protein